MSSDDLQYEKVAPKASAMIESMRAHGYTLSTALADLIDNSIAAGAKNIWIDSKWAGPDSWISVSDDGCGMTEAELTAAMRLGSQNPTEPRAQTDLGRFGLGLKTASLSQCRRMSVVTKRHRCVATRRWDLDYLAEKDDGWRLLKSLHPNATDRTRRLAELGSGTVVLWETLDRLAGDDESFFLESIDGVMAHVAMVFHRFLEVRKRLQIFVNDNRIEPWDPFLESHPATYKSPDEVLTFDSSEVHVVGFVLPHFDKLDAAAFETAGGIHGWNVQQGFYVYRNERLIVHGSWLGLGSPSWTKQEHYKLARLRLDIPNSMDHLWHLDVKKSNATPPPQLRSRLQELGAEIRKHARKVFAHRGKYKKRRTKAELARPWYKQTRADRVIYRVNRQHPLIAAILDEFTKKQQKSLFAMFRLLEETVPVEQIWLDASDNPEGTKTPFQDVPPKDLRRVIELGFELLTKKFKSQEKALEALAEAEEFSGDEAAAIIGELQGDL